MPPYFGRKTYQDFAGSGSYRCCLWHSAVIGIATIARWINNSGGCFTCQPDAAFPLDDMSIYWLVGPELSVGGLLRRAVGGASGMAESWVGSDGGGTGWQCNFGTCSK